jgi:hypothetical protein
MHLLIAYDFDHFIAKSFMRIDNTYYLFLLFKILYNIYRLYSFSKMMKIQMISFTIEVETW